ncbi:MAG: lysostaphin resistance A-like protein [Bacteroidia bacterium]
MKILPFLKQGSLGLRISVLLLICVLGASEASFFSLLLSLLIWDLPVDALQHYSAYGTAGIAMMKFTQAFASMGLFVFPPLIYASLIGQKPRHFLMLDERPSIPFLAFASILMAIQLPWINALGSWNNSIEWGGMFRSVYESMRAQEDAAAALIADFLYMPGPIDLFQTLLIVALIPAIGEELLFRGVVQPMLSEKRGVHFGVWITAFVFSFIHFQFFGFFPRFILGVILGYMVVWKKSLWYSIVAHFTNNALAVIGYFAYQHQWIELNPDEWGTGENSLLWVCLSLIFGIVSFLTFYKFAKRQEQSALH